MKKILFAIVLTASLAMAKSWTGTISDAKCGKAHADASSKSMECVQKCVKGGQAAVFVTGDQVLKFDGASGGKIKDHLGHKVTINGKLKGDTITVKSVAMAK